MHKRINQLQDHHDRSRKIITFFILDLLFLILSIIAAVIQTEYSRITIILCLSMDIVCIIHTFTYSMKNLILVNHLEEYFFNKNYGASLQKQNQLRKLLDENLFSYCFQPIVNAATGEIFAYEVLMRTDPDTIDLLPLEILDLASREGRLYDVEKRTFFNTLKLRKELSETFGSKKLFINSVSTHPLSDDDFHLLQAEYTSVLPEVIIEINEGANIRETTTGLLHRRRSECGLQLALDDYGTGYSGDGKLSYIKPDYIKIDRSVIKYINIDSKKQARASEIINVAKNNDIKIIAEGVENQEELEYVIGLGVDYIQGYYTGKPEASPAGNIPDDALQKILRVNYKKFCESSSKKIFETHGEAELTLAEISSDLYYSIVIYEDEIILKGNTEQIYDLAIVVPDNKTCRITLDNVSLRNTERPSVLLGSNSKVVLHLVGTNQMIHDGIRVCETAGLTITGDGSLFINADRTGKIGIGGSDSQTYGNITLASTGRIQIISSGNISIGVGGGQNPSKSHIHFASGDIQIEAVGYNAICVGSIVGYSNIRIDSGCRLKAKAEATKAVGIGNLLGYTRIETSGDLDIRCSARVSANIGVLEEGDGSIVIRGGTSNIKFNSQKAIGIGAVKGNMDISFLDGDYMISGEGRELIGLGDHSGNSIIKIKGGVLSIQIFANNAMMTGGIIQKIIIDSGNIQCDFPEGTILVNSYGTPLVSHIITNSDEFLHTIETVAYSYEYKAIYSERHPFIKVYLPEYSTIN